MDHTAFQKCSLSDLRDLAAHLVNAFPDQRIFAFYGDLGAGKTTFIKAFCELLGVKEEVTSPSFAIVNEYFGNQNSPVYHFDFYRIRKLEEVLDIGYEEYLYSGSYCFLEWADKIEELLPGSFVQISMEKCGQDDLRNIKVQKV